MTNPMSPEFLAFITVAVMNVLARFLPGLDREPVATALRASITGILYVTLVFAFGGGEPNLAVFLQALLVVLGVEGTQRTQELVAAVRASRQAPEDADSRNGT